MIDTIYLLQPELLSHHPIASLHREMSNMEFESLKLDIELNGQLIPALTYKGKLVDGRHRQKALIELGIHDMKCIALPGNISLNTVKEKVLGTEIRRQDTVAQKAIRAYNWLLDTTGVTQQDAAVKFGITQSRISEAKKLYNLIGKRDFDKLYKQGYLFIGGQNHSQMSLIIKLLNTDTIKQTEPLLISESVQGVSDILMRLKREGDIVGITQIESIAKRIRQDID